MKKLVSKNQMIAKRGAECRIQEGIAEYLEQRGLFLPIICTPEELLGGQDDE